MSGENDWTTMRVRKSTLELVKKLGRMGDNPDDVVRPLVEKALKEKLRS